MLSVLSGKHSKLIVVLIMLSIYLNKIIEVNLYCYILLILCVIDKPMSDTLPELYPWDLKI